MISLESLLKEQVLESLILETKAVDFRLFDGDNISRRAEYRFEVNDVIMSCFILATNSEGFYEVTFKRAVVGDYEERLNKGTRFMFTVIATVAECVGDYIEKNSRVKALVFTGKGSRLPAYKRFISNNFPDKKITETSMGLVLFLDSKTFDKQEELKSSFYDFVELLEDLFIDDADLEVSQDLTLDRNRWLVQVMGNLKSNKNYSAITVKRREDGSYNVMTNYNIAVPGKRSESSKVFKNGYQAGSYIIKSLPKNT